MVPKFLGVLLLIALILILLPFAWVFNAMRLPWIIYKRFYRPYSISRLFRQTNPRYGRKKRILIILGFGVLGLILLPISMTAILIPTSCVVAY